MIDDRIKSLSLTIKKLYHRGAIRNIQKIFEKTHTADIAGVMETLSLGERLDIFKLEPSKEKRAEIISYLESETQREVLSCLESNEVRDLVSLMESDDAADLLGQLPEDMAGDILKSMVQKDSEEVADLMGYPEDSAGGLMSTQVFYLNQEFTVGEAVKKIQSEDDESLITFYIYVVDDDERLIGVLSLKQLLLSKTSDLLKDIMSKDVISVKLTEKQEEVARIVERYDFLALPVVDESNKFMGAITVDDVIDVIRAEAEEDFMAMGRAGWSMDLTAWGHIKARFPWLGLTFLGGLVSFFIIYIFVSGRFGGENAQNWLVIVAFTPLLLSLGATAGSQAATVAVQASLSGKLDRRSLLSHMMMELKVILAFSALLSVMVYVIVGGFTSWGGLSGLMSAAMAIQMIISIGLASLIPLLFNKLGLDPTVATIPIFTVVADASAVTVLYGLARHFLGV